MQNLSLTIQALNISEINLFGLNDCTSKNYVRYGSLVGTIYSALQPYENDLLVYRYGRY